MATIIDTIRISGSLRPRLADLEVPFPGDGLLAIVDPNDPRLAEVAGAGGRAATITRPDGSRIERAIAGVEVRHGVAALYFAGLAEADVPRLSRVEWEGGPSTSGVASV